MGLDVGVVKFQYIERPDKLLYDFLWHLHLKTSYDDEIWQISEGMNTILEIKHPEILRHAAEFVADDEVDEDGESRIIKWISDLPWDEHGGEDGEDVITLHLSW